MFECFDLNVVVVVVVVRVLRSVPVASIMIRCRCDCSCGQSLWNGCDMLVVAVVDYVATVVMKPLMLALLLSLVRFACSVSSGSWQ